MGDSPDLVVMSCSPTSAAQGCLLLFNRHASALCHFEVYNCHVALLGDDMTGCHLMQIMLLSC